jgi:ubiquitin-conjugating enzyme E2 W
MFLFPLDVVAFWELNKTISHPLQEFEKFQTEAADDGLTVEVVSDSVWHVSFVGATGTIYQGEPYTLRVRFTDDYPMDSPEVVFLTPSPVHPHIYSNGHICLNILADDWSPALTVKSIVLSILSMMSSATEKALPVDNERYTRGGSRNPKETHFVFHDDRV